MRSPVIFGKYISYSNTNGAICANSMSNSGADSQACDRRPVSSLEEKLFALSASATKPQAHRNGAVNELRCHWLRTSVRRKRKKERKRGRQKGEKVICNEIATCHTKQEQQV